MDHPYMHVLYVQYFALRAKCIYMYQIQEHLADPGTICE